MTADPHTDYSLLCEDIIKTAIVALDANYVHGERKANVLFELVEVLIRHTGWEPDVTAFDDDPWVTYAFGLVDTANLLREAARARAARKADESS